MTSGLNCGMGTHNLLYAGIFSLEVAITRRKLGANEVYSCGGPVVLQVP